ncbi:hypothetical protein L4D09_08875 [Photobacterium makurazakiensis]|uniref:hypothetical protein n=1 Tax=Photobacterium makurazakiensis TaxID=2910234 RepID=UPI003D100043
MMKYIGNIIKKTILVTLIVFGIQAYGSDYYPEVGECVAKSSWFKQPVLPPAEGVESPFAFVDGEDKSTNCNFHQWSWNKFLYLMQTDSKTDDLVMFGPNFYQVDNKMMPYFEPWNDMLNPTGTKLLKLMVLDDITQADGTVLSTKQDLGPVRYSIHVNDTFYQSAIDALNNGVNIGDKFEVGSVEIKAAWVDMAQLELLYPDTDIQQRFYVREALVEDDSVFKERANFALLGIHVVGIVENHPEFIWATFEHSMLSPDYFEGPADNSKYYDSSKAVSAVKDYALYKVGSKGSDVTLVGGSDKVINNTFRMFQYGVPTGLPYLGTDVSLSASSEQREQDKDTFSNITQLNDSVDKNLAENDSIWGNYFYSGSIWLSVQGYNFADGISGNIVGSKANPHLRGSLGLANITMETTFQAEPNPNTMPDKMVANNCFTCHGIGKDKSTMFTSHIFKNLVNSMQQ